jgi:hypothetical protein
MKKTLLGTSALIGAALLATAATAGEDPKVTIGGFSLFEAGWTNSDNDTNERNRAFRNDNEIHFNVAGKTDGGIGYGAEIDLQADIDGGGNGRAGAEAPGQTNSGIVAHRTYGWVQGDNWGHLEFGSNDGVARTMKVDAASIARATGGIEGDYKYFADSNTQTGIAGNNGPTGGFAGAIAGHAVSYISSPNLPIENGDARVFSSDNWSNATKISYYTPRFTGFQAGVSYAPSLDRGQNTLRVNTVAGSGLIVQDIWEGALNYQNQFDQVGVSVAATGEIGKTSGNNFATGLQNQALQAWNAGAKLSYMGFSLAGSYGDWSDSFNASGTKADYWTVGGAYETGPLGASVTYLSSEDKRLNANDKFQDVSVGVDYKLAPGLTPFAEYTWYDIDAPTGALENKGNVVIIGSELSF